MSSGHGTTSGQGPSREDGRLRSKPESPSEEKSRKADFMKKFDEYDPQDVAFYDLMGHDSDLDTPPATSGGAPLDRGVRSNEAPSIFRKSLESLIPSTKPELPDCIAMQQRLQSILETAESQVDQIRASIVGAATIEEDQDQLRKENQRLQHGITFAKEEKSRATELSKEVDWLKTQASVLKQSKVSSDRKIEELENEIKAQEERLTQALTENEEQARLIAKLRKDPQQKQKQAQMNLRQEYREDRSARRAQAVASIQARYHSLEARIEDLENENAELKLENEFHQENCHVAKTKDKEDDLHLVNILKQKDAEIAGLQKVNRELRLTMEQYEADEEEKNDPLRSDAEGDGHIENGDDALSLADAEDLQIDPVIGGEPLGNVLGVETVAEAVKQQGSSHKQGSDSESLQQIINTLAADNKKLRQQSSRTLEPFLPQARRLRLNGKLSKQSRDLLLTIEKTVREGLKDD